MEKILIKSDNQSSKVAIMLNSCAIILFIFRTSVPFFKYPFIIILLISILNISLYHRNRLNIAVKSLVNIKTIIIIFIYLIISFAFSAKVYISVFKDIINIAIILLFYIIFSVLIKNKHDLIYFIETLFKLIIITAIISLFNFYAGLLIFLPSNSNALLIKILSSDFSFQDTNFSLIPFFLALVILIIKTIQKKLNNLDKFFFLFLGFFTLSVILSGSRRGFILLNLFILLTFILCIIYWYKSSYKSYIGFNLLIILLSSTLIPIIIYVGIISLSCNDKNKILHCLGVENLNKAKNYITLNTYKITREFFKNYSDFYLYEFLWGKIDPLDPDCGWGLNEHKTITPLYGKNKELVPEGAKGYLVDSTSIGSYIDYLNLLVSHTVVFTIDAVSKNEYKASVFCYVSEDSNVNSAEIKVEPNAVITSILKEDHISNYLLGKKGEWQKLEIHFTAYKSGRIPILIGFSKDSAKEMSSIKGFIIFAYPQIKNISNGTNYLECNKHLKSISKIYNHNSIKLEDSSKKNILVNKATLFYNFQDVFKTEKEPDLIRNRINKLISEDTTYYGFKTNLSVDLKYNFIRQRTDRWKFALKIFSIEYNWKQKLLGGGFYFLNWYGYYFENDKTKNDYPHNPFLYILLYSGMLGVIIYILLLVFVIRYYWKYRKDYPVLPIFFLIVYFFTFFSGGNPLDPPVMGFFLMLPFLIHSIHKNNEKEYI